LQLARARARLPLTPSCLTASRSLPRPMLGLQAQSWSSLWPALTPGGGARLGRHRGDAP
jgi:hypothetical protein